MQHRGRNIAMPKEQCQPRSYGAITILVLFIITIILVTHQGIYAPSRNLPQDHHLSESSSTILITKKQYDDNDNNVTRQRQTSTDDGNTPLSTTIHITKKNPTRKKRARTLRNTLYKILLNRIIEKSARRKSTVKQHYPFTVKNKKVNKISDYLLYLYSTMNVALMNIYLNNNMPDRRARKNQLKNRLLLDNQRYRMGKTNHFFCNKSHYCYTINPDTKEKIYYHCNIFYCYAINKPHG